MADKIQAIRGMNDRLPHETCAWRVLENLFSTLLQSYGYGEIRTPILESTHLFKRSVGESSDIVEKELYSFTDLNGDSLSLRPEGTACVVRSAIEQGLLHNQTQKLWYCGPMFRHERPQKGRYRQFHQLGVEAFGFEGTAVEIEQLLLCQRLWQKLRIQEAVTLELNTIGTFEEREAYKTQLVAYFSKHLDALDPDSVRRLKSNPLRILDSKNPDMQPLIERAPKLIDTLGAQSKARFDTLCAALTRLGIAYTINPNLVRGLDYYEHLVFEWVTDKLGSQATVCAGGRYDSLVAQLGGKSIAASGFALGVERLLLLLAEMNPRFLQDNTRPLVYFISDSAPARMIALKLAEDIRQAIPDATVWVGLSEASFKSQFKKADKSNAKYAVVIGEEEQQSHTLTLKYLREDKAQETLAQSALVKRLTI